MAASVLVEVSVSAGIPVELREAKRARDSAATEVRVLESAEAADVLPSSRDALAAARRTLAHAEEALRAIRKRLELEAVARVRGGTLERPTATPTRVALASVPTRPVEPVQLTLWGLP